MQTMADRGQCDSEAAMITLADRLASAHMRITLLHEVLHAVYEHVGQIIPSADNADDHAEGIVAMWAPSLLGVLRDNPALVAYLTSD